MQHLVVGLPSLPPTAAADTAMEPVVVDGCFGWLHRPAADFGADTAVLLCPGLRDDGLTAHSQFRRLAAALAHAGYPTMRFDYAGTADSADADPAQPLWAQWRGSVHAAADWLRAAVGATQIALCGLRLGATLAAEAAAERSDVVALGLLAPTPRGRTFIRQWEVEAKLAGRRPSEPLRLHGVALSQDDAVAIAAVELQQAMPPPGCATMLFNPAPSAVLDQCAQAWQAQGATVELGAFAGLEPMLRSRVMAHEPPADFGPLLAWLHRVAPALPRRIAAELPVATLAGPEWRETPVRFGPGERLFGMLCQPADGPGRQAVVIVNSGGDPHYGADRCGANMARQFAASGIASLRMDFAGLGDSLAAADGQTHVFETDRRSEVSAALDALAARGYAHLALCGVCSGAYHGFHAAVADARVETLLLVNLPTFAWQDGTDIESFRLYDAGIGERARHAWSSGLWRRMLRGELGIQRQAWSRVRRLALAVLGRSAAPAAVEGADPAIREAVATLSRRTRTLILMSPHELGLLAIEAAFGPGRAMPGVTLEVLASIDHTATEPAMRARITAKMIAFLTGPGVDG